MTETLLGTIIKSGDFGANRKTTFHPNKETASTLRTSIFSDGGELLVIEMEDYKDEYNEKRTVAGW